MNLEELMEEEVSKVEGRFYSCGCKGRPTIADVTNIYKEDADFINKNKLVLSLEELSTGQYCLYLADPENSENEVLTLANGRSCQETIQNLVHLYKKNQEGVEK